MIRLDRGAGPWWESDWLASPPSLAPRPQNGNRSMVGILAPNGWLQRSASFAQSSGSSPRHFPPLTMNLPCRSYFFSPLNDKIDDSRYFHLLVTTLSHMTSELQNHNQLLGIFNVEVQPTVRADLGGHLKYSRRWSGVRAGVLLGAQGAVRRGESRGGL